MLNAVFWTGHDNSFSLALKDNRNSYRSRQAEVHTKRYKSDNIILKQKKRLFPA